MRIYLVLAHPEQHSFNTSLAYAQRDALLAAGHEVRFRNLHQDHFNPLLTRSDFPDCHQTRHVQLPSAQATAAKNGNTASDVTEEHENLNWANAVILQFPLWLYGMPAILKGWCERVLSEGTAHHPARNLWFERGGFAGKRLLLSTTTNGRSETYSHRGRHGSLDIILWPVINAFFFSGFQVVRPSVAFDVVRATRAQRQALLRAAVLRALDIDSAALLPMHKLHDYEKNGVLRTDVIGLTPGQQKPDTFANQP